MSEKIVQLNEEVIKGQIKELVRGSVEEALDMCFKVCFHHEYCISSYWHLVYLKKRTHCRNLFLQCVLGFSS